MQQEVDAIAEGCFGAASLGLSVLVLLARIKKMVVLDAANTLPVAAVGLFHILLAFVFEEDVASIFGLESRFGFAGVSSALITLVVAPIRWAGWGDDRLWSLVLQPFLWAAWLFSFVNFPGRDDPS